MNSVLEIKGHICIGCGVCAGVCPAECLTMQNNREGGYSPILNNNKCIDCGICKKVCPFLSDNSVNNVFVSYNLDDYSLIGNSKSNYVGHVISSSFRENSASGGFLSAVLMELFEKNKIDYAICAQKTNHTDPLFSMVVCTSREDMKKSAGSVYYPVHYEHVLRHIQNCDGRYAIVATPCVAKAIRKTMSVFSEMKDRISYIMGLTCGVMKSKFFAEQIICEGKVKIENVTSLVFRNKRVDKPAQDHEARIHYSENGINKIKLVPFSIMSRHTSLKACAYCNDVFALDADAVFMDAWLSPYRMQWRGTSIVCIRNQYLADLIEAMNKKKIYAKPIELADVIKSQKATIRQKTICNQFRTNKKGFDLSDTSIGNFKTNVIDRLYYRINFKQACRAGDIWLKCKDVKTFKRKVRFGSLSKIVVSLLRKFV